MDKSNVLLVAVAPEVEVRLVSSLGPILGIRTVADGREARTALHKEKPAVAVVSAVGGALADRMEAVSDLAAQGVPVIVLGERKDPEQILAAMRAGAKEFLAASELERVERCVQRFLEESGGIKLGQITVVFPVKGGMGATALATNLAGALQRPGGRSCLVDLDLELGDVLSFLDLKGSYSLADVAANARRLDRDLLDSSVPRHSSGIWVLSQCEKIADIQQLDATSVTAVLRFLRQHYDQVVLDGLNGFGDLPLAALDLADRILLLVTQEVPAVRAAQRCAEILKQLGLGPRQVMLVVNRYQKSSPIRREVIEETVGLPVGAVVANDFQSLTRSINRGVLLSEEAPRSPAARDIDALARLLTSKAEAAAPEPGLLKKLFTPRIPIHGAE